MRTNSSSAGRGQETGAKPVPAAPSGGEEDALEQTPVRVVHEFLRRMSPVPCPNPGTDLDQTGAIMGSIRVLSVVIERQANRILEDLGMTLPQWLALGCIAHAGEEGIPHSQLGQRLMVSKAPVTGIVDRLERAGWVARRADASDRRISRVVATPDGSATWWRVRDLLKDNARRICGDSLSTAEMDQLLSLMGRLLEAFAQHDPSLPDFPAPHEEASP